jgi:AcrR family transcriptional regulator
LPPGRHGIPPEQVAENQRWRLLGAAAEVLAERGYAHTRSADIARRAAVSSATFYENFENVDACLLAAHRMAAECVCGLVSGGCESAPPTEWPARLHSAVDAVLKLIASEPALASLLGPAAPAAALSIAAARDGLIERLAAFLYGGRALRGEAIPELLPDIELRLIAGAIGLVSDRVRDGEAERLPELAAELAAILLIPYGSVGC